MRNTIGPRKVKRLRASTGLDVLTALTRGGTEHRIDLCLSDGSITHLYADGTLETELLIRWPAEKWRTSHTLPAPEPPETKAPA